ncbi:hypothetical protein CLOP_g8193 [Closterium sp. NIES-67]|nr:hypothetical protein CLOP_g8193 [Closterium sp. NIES-67]
MTSVGGFICCVGGGPTAWESKKQVDQALSSVESEYMALFRAIREVVWQRRLLAELGEEQQGPTPLYCDSQVELHYVKTTAQPADMMTKRLVEQQHWESAAGGVEGFEEPATVGKVTLHSLDFWVIDSGATYSMTPLCFTVVSWHI